MTVQITYCRVVLFYGMLSNLFLTYCVCWRILQGQVQKRGDSNLEKNFEIKEMPVEYSDNSIYGKAYIPLNKTGGLSAVILCHGYNSSYRHMTDLAEVLAENGVFAYCFDFCGGAVVSMSSGKPADMSIRTEICDLNAVAEMIRGLECVAPNRVYLYGESQGGFVSALTAAERPENFAGLFLLYPAFCIPDDWEKFAAGNNSDSFELMGMTLSRKFYDELPEYDVFSYVSRYDKSVVIAHGTADTVVSVEYSRRLVKSFPDAELTEFENEGHGFSATARKKWREQICRKLCGR